MPEPLVTPRITDSCAVCHHIYGDHSETYDHETFGCEADTLGMYRCPCEGFCVEED